MAATFTAELIARLVASETWTLDQGNLGGNSHKVDATVSVAAGTAASEIDLVWSDSRSLAVGTEQLELDNLTQLDSAGATLNARTFSVVKAILIRNTTASGLLTIGGGTGGAGAADAFAGAGYPMVADSDKIDIPFGGFFFWYDPAGAAVTNGATDVLEVEATTATQTYEIAIIGED
jgi:hypothetical protein